MKILIVTQYYFPEQFQINDIALELVKRRHEVTVLCGIPNYPKGELVPGYRTVEECKDREREYFQKTSTLSLPSSAIMVGRKQRTASTSTKNGSARN